MQPHRSIADHLFPIIISLSLLCVSSLAHAQRYASIIVDDLGNNLARGKAVIHFPAPITLAILPRTTFATSLAKLAHSNNKEIILHLPLEPIHDHTHEFSPGTLNMDMTQVEFLTELKNNIRSVPHIKGINNHMGSLLTMNHEHMGWLMQEVSDIGDLYFVDSRTTAKSVATEVASINNVPALKRDIFLDPDYKLSTMTRQLQRFIDIIKKQGYGVALAHPHPRTLKFIKDNLETLKSNGIELVTVSELIEKQSEKTNVACTGTTCTGL